MDTRLVSAATIEPKRPGISSWVKMMRAETKMVTRDITGCLLPIGLPVLLMAMQGLSLDTGQELAPGVKVIDAIVMPVTITMVISMIAIMNFPTLLATYRKSRMLRRLAVTPASPAMVLVSQVVVSFAQALLGIGVAMGVAVAFFDASAPHHAVLAILAFLAISVSMYSVGMFIAAVAPSPNSAMAMGLVAFFGMAAVGGMFGSTQNLPELLADVGSWLPFGAGVQALQSTWIGESVGWQNWVSFGATTAICGTVSAVFFRWE